VGRYGELPYTMAILALSFALFKLLGCSSPSIIAFLTPLIALAHELIHLASLKALGLRYALAYESGKVGFRVTFRSPKQYIVCALSPQVLTIALLTLSVFVRELAILAVIHVAMSIHDIRASAKYLRTLLS